MRFFFSGVAVFLWVTATVNAQSVSGQFSQWVNREIRIEGFNGLETYLITEGQTDSFGRFKLAYAEKDIGMGYLSAGANKSYSIVLSGEDVVLEGQQPGSTKTIRVIQGQENKWFVQYAREQPKREQMLNAWRFLQKNYQQDSLFEQAYAAKQAISSEIDRLYESEKRFLSSLPANSYVKWFLPIRKLVSSVSVVAQYYPQDIPATRTALREINYADPRLYKSGLFKESLENHVWFIENSSGPLDSVYAELEVSIDGIVDQLVEDEAKYNEIVGFLFTLFEERSLFAAAEYLALKVLDEQRCTLTSDVAKQLEAYRKMAVGAIVPDINFSPYTYYPEGISPKKLSELKADYYLVIFAAGWCPHCTKDMPKIVDLYPEWQEKGIEVILVSLDGSATEFAQFAGGFPFISTTDYKVWDGKAVQDYFVFGTPTYYLLDKKRTLLLRPNNVEHLKVWIDYKIE
jgi:thiol-disulfide isomerase/thioredoxin